MTLSRSTMMMAALALAVAAQPTHAQAPGAVGRWQVDWGDRRCSLIRHPVGDQPMLVLRTTPGTRVWDLLLIRHEWPRGLRGERPVAVVRLQPSGSTTDGSVEGGATSLGRTIWVSGLHRDFVDRFAGSRSVSLGSDQQVFYEIAIDSARQAVAALRECETDALRQWGIDPEAFAAVSVPASVNVAALISDADYPVDAITAGLSGVSMVRITIDRNGRVTECAPIAGSNVEILDSRTCRILRSRARFDPARDANGQAISSQLVTSIAWQL